MAKAKKVKPEEVEVKTTPKEASEADTSQKDSSPVADEPEIESPKKGKSKKKSSKDSTKGKDKSSKKSEDESENPEEDKKEEDDEPITKKNHIIIEEIDEDAPSAKKAHWYIIHTYSGHEHRVANTLIQRLETLGITGKVLELLIATQDKILIKRGKKSTVKEKIFPGYMLIRMMLDDESWLAVRTTPGVTSFVGIGNKPTPLPPKEVDSIKKFMAMEAPKYKNTFTLGEAVRIIEGPFADFLGSVDSIDDARGKVKVLVSIFGRETPVELDFLQVTKI